MDRGGGLSLLHAHNLNSLARPLDSCQPHHQYQHTRIQINAEQCASSSSSSAVASTSKSEQSIPRKGARRSSRRSSRSSSPEDLRSTSSEHPSAPTSGTQLALTSAVTGMAVMSDGGRGASPFSNGRGPSGSPEGSRGNGGGGGSSGGGGGGGSGGGGSQPNGNGSYGGGAAGDGRGDGKGADKAAEERSKKKANPLEDLIDTEVAYVAELGKIIKKVASAWSRSNFPPPELDTMFRNVEAIYRANRSFLKALKDIGPNPSSPKALGDLLMRWIDDLEEPYTRYCDNFFAQFDSWPTVQSNPRLRQLLDEISSPTLADGSPVVFSDRKRVAGDRWTLDELFSQPHLRLKYYKKLYSRLLKSTQPGRSDHRLLVGANEKLDELLERAKQRISMSVLDELPGARNRESDGVSSQADTQDGDFQDRASSATSTSVGPSSQKSITNRSPTGSPPALTPARQGGSAPAPSINPAGPTITPVDDLVERLDLSRTLDIFTLKPKVCQLQMSPPNLPFKRGLRRSADVVIHFSPSFSSEELVFRRAHIFLLTDLFLVCERMTPSQRADNPNPKADMWLLYPPLAGKHLRVTDTGGAGNAFEVLVFKKEKLSIHTESKEAKEKWMATFEECQQFAASVGLQVKTGNMTSGASSPNGSSPSGGGIGVSPVISVTPSSLARQSPSDLPSFSPHSSTGSQLAINGNPSSLNRDNSFNSVASFPKAPMQRSETASPVTSPSVGPVSVNGTGVTLRPNGGLNMQGRPPPPGGPMGMRSPPTGPQQMQGRPPMMGRPMNGYGGRPPFPGGPGGGPGGIQHQRPPPPPPPPLHDVRNGRPPQPIKRPSMPDLRGQGMSEAERMEKARSTSSSGSGGAGGMKLPSEMLKTGLIKPHNESFSPPPSPTLRNQPQTSTVAAQMRCKVFLKQNHAQWKSLGNARLKLYHLMPDDKKQLVVENDRKTLISTIVLTDGVERVGKVGLAVELSDHGARTGIIYMLQMRSEESAGGLFGQLLEGSDRTTRA